MCEAVVLVRNETLKHDDSKELPVMAMWKIWNCQTLHKSLEITNALIAVHVTSLPGSLYVCLHFATAHVPAY